MWERSAVETSRLHRRVQDSALQHDAPLHQKQSTEKKNFFFLFLKFCLETLNKMACSLSGARVSPATLRGGRHQDEQESAHTVSTQRAGGPQTGDRPEEKRWQYESHSFILTIFNGFDLSGYQKYFNNEILEGQSVKFDFACTVWLSCSSHVTFYYRSFPGRHSQ